MNPFYTNQFSYSNITPVNQPFQPYFSAPQQNAPPQDNLIQSLYTTVQLQPYNNQQFLYKTFGAKADYITVFLTLPHEDKLKMFLLMQQKRIYGQINDKEGYQKILRQIANKLQNYNAFHNGNKQQKIDTSEQKKKKDLESKIDLFCQTSFRKLKLKEDNNNINGQSVKKSVNYVDFNDFQENEQEEEWIESKQQPTNSQLNQNIQIQSGQNFGNQYNFESNKQNIAKFTTNISNESFNQTNTISNSNNQSNSLVYNMFTFDPQMERALTKEIGLKLSNELQKQSIWQLSLQQSQLKSNEPDLKEIFAKKQQPKPQNRQNLQKSNQLLTSSHSNSNNEQFNIFQQYKKPNASIFQSYQPQSNHDDKYSFINSQTNSKDEGSDYFGVNSLSQNMHNHSQVTSSQQQFNFDNFISHIPKQPQFNNMLQIQQLNNMPQNTNNLFANNANQLHSTNDHSTKLFPDKIQNDLEINTNKTDQNDEQWQQAENVDPYHISYQSQQNPSTKNIQNYNETYQNNIIYEVEQNNTYSNQGQNNYNNESMRQTIDYNDNLFDIGAGESYNVINHGYNITDSATIETNDQNIQYLMPSQNNNPVLAQTYIIQSSINPITTTNKIQAFDFNFQPPLSYSQPQTYQYTQTLQTSSSNYYNQVQKQPNNQVIDPLFSYNNQTKYDILDKLKIQLSNKHHSYLQKSMENKYYQCDTECYQIAINYLREIEQENTADYLHLKDQLKIVQQIHQLTSQNTAAVDEQQQQKVEICIKKTKKLFNIVYNQSPLTHKYLLKLLNKKSKQKGILYKFGRILIDSSISLQIIQKCCNQQNKQNIFNSFCIIYTLQKLNIHSKVKINTQRMVQYLNQQYNKYKDLSNSTIFSQIQQNSTAHPNYTTYIKGLIKLASICQKMLQLSKISCIKTSCNVVKTMKICKDLKLKYEKFLDDKQPKFALLYLKDFFHKAIKDNSSLYQIYTIFSQKLRQYELCHICLQRIDNNGGKHNELSYHYSCFNILQRLQG